MNPELLKILKFKPMFLSAIFSRRSHSWKTRLALFLTALLTIVFLSHPLGTVAQQRFPEVRGVWMTNNDTRVLADQNALEAAMTQLGQLNFNTVYPVVWNSGFVHYPSATAQRAGIQTFIRRGNQGQDILADLVEKAHRNGLLVLPWFEFGFMTPPFSELAKAHPEWLTQKQDGTRSWVGTAGEVYWLNPFHPEVQQFITQIVLEVLDQYNVDGVQFDDHASLPNQFGYDSFTTAMYRRETGRAAPSNATDPAWVRWRADKLTAFMVELNRQVKAKQPNAIFSVSPNPYDFAYRGQLQDWLAWLRRGVIDELLVQVYRPDLAAFRENLVRPEIQEARQRIPTGVGILTGLRNRPVGLQQIQAKIQSARQQGLGFSFFFYDSLWNYAPEPADQRKSLFQVLFRFPAKRTSVTNAPLIAES